MRSGYYPGQGHTPGQPARPARTPDRQRPPRQAGRVRRQGQVVDNDDGVMLDYTVEPGDPADAPQLAPAIERVIRRTGRTPRTVTADRGYGEKRVDDALQELGVRTVGDPPQRQTRQGPISRRTPPSVPASREMANRKRRPDQHPQTRLRLGPHPHRRHRRCPNLDRARPSSPTTWSSSAATPPDPGHREQSTPPATSTVDCAPIPAQPRRSFFRSK
jgi:IS5 family transposase